MRELTQPAACTSSSHLRSRSARQPVRGALGDDQSGRTLLLVQLESRGGVVPCERLVQAVSVLAERNHRHDRRVICRVLKRHRQRTRECVRHDRLERERRRRPGVRLAVQVVHGAVQAPRPVQRHEVLDHDAHHLRVPRTIAPERDRHQRGQHKPPSEVPPRVQVHL